MCKISKILRKVLLWLSLNRDERKGKKRGRQDHSGGWRDHQSIMELGGVLR